MVVYRPPGLWDERGLSAGDEGLDALLSHSGVVAPDCSSVGDSC